MHYRDLIVGKDTLVKTARGKVVKYVNFDNAATTPAFIKVANDINKFLPYYSSVHRGMGIKSQLTTKAYERGRELVGEFLNFSLDEYDVIFVKNTTEAINKLSNMLLQKYSNKIVLSTFMEHHSNDLPWRKFNIDYVRVDSKGMLLLEDLEEKLKSYNGKVGIVAVTGASNVTGYKNPVHKIAKIVHSYGAKLLVDGAQLVPHCPFDINGIAKDEYIDFAAFSAHKMYAPFGTGVLIVRKNEFKDIEPDYKGGGTVDMVTHDFVKWSSTPEKDEAGSPNVLGVVALSSSIEMLRGLGMKNIEDYEKDLQIYICKAISSLPNIKVYSEYCSNSVSIITFNIEGIYHETVSKALSYEYGIGVRSGCFCAHPYIQELLKVPKEEVMANINNKAWRKPGMVRVSFALYNTFNEIDYFIYALKDILKRKDYFINKYD